MVNINTTILIGYLAKDMELGYTANGMAVGNFSIAVNRDVKRDGAWVKEASFFDVSAFGKLPENLKPYLTKGKQVAVEGFLKQDRWQDQQGQNRSKVTIVANNIQLLGGKDNASNNGYGDNDGFGYGN